MSAGDGILVINKPAGMTSHDVVGQVRRIIGTKKAGHAGTLDPDATGVLVVAVGQATRLLPHLPTEPKEYIARIAFGRATDTEDASGVTTDEADASALTSDDIEAILPRFTGEIEQIPPMVSAVHHQGRRLYELAREGITVERQARRILIHEISASDFASGTAPKATLRVICGGGTYIRTLCADIGAALGFPAHMKTLLRNAVGPYRLVDALSIDQLMARGRTALQPMEQSLEFAVSPVSEEESERLGRGQSIMARAGTPEGAEIMLLYRERLRALARHTGDELHPFKVFETDKVI